MPVKWVLHWQPNVGATVSSQILMEVSQCLESFNGVRDGRWKSTLTFYRAMVREPSMAAEFPRDFMGISLPDAPKKYHFILRGHRLVVEADSTIQTVMEKLQSYKARVSLNFEGIQYKIGDFQVRVGKVVPANSESLRGIVMEVSYLPISSMDMASQMMEDFVDIWQEAVSRRSLPGHFMHIEPNFAEYSLGDCYTHEHSAVQYATVMAQLIAAVQSAQLARN